jgi:hypothetical protein
MQFVRLVHAIQVEFHSEARRLRNIDLAVANDERRPRETSDVDDPRPYQYIFRPICICRGSLSVAVICPNAALLKFEFGAAQ